MNSDENNPPLANSEIAPEIAPTSVVTPVATVEVAGPKPHANTPGVIVLQWLTYAFWGWLIIALIWLLSVILINAILGTSVSTVVPYAIAGGIVLLPIAFFTDFFYRKHEPLKKTGVAMVIMVIHAVVFALLAIASLITAVFNGLNAVIEGSGNVNTQLVVLYTSIGATVLYVVTFLRTLNPFKSVKPLFLYSVGMVAFTLVLLILTIVGPLIQSISTRDDRRIEQYLPTVSSDINNYISENDKLPATLDEVTFSNEAVSSLVEDGLVVYKPETSKPSDIDPINTEHRYQLCVTFKLESDSSTNGYTSDRSNSNTYSSYLSTYDHGKGEVCYKVEEKVRSQTTFKSIDLNVDFGRQN